MIKDEILDRKGARKPADIPVEVLELLNKGEIETANLTEWLAINQLDLIKNTFHSLDFSEYIPNIETAILSLKKQSTMSCIKVVGETLFTLAWEDNKLDSVINKLSNHLSDTLRCYATYLIALDYDLTIDKKLTKSTLLIADKHFGVRELVWMALRPVLEKDLNFSIQELLKLTKNKDENIRRFASEVLRPRGVWCKHIDALKENPELLLPVLEGLKSDESKYVQDSVANWLNDASKTQPQFVIDLCDRWLIESPTLETKRIVKRARRTIDKK